MNGGSSGGWVGLAQARDGSLLLSDDTNGIIYRIAYTGVGGAGEGPSTPTNVEGADVRMTGAPLPQPPAPTPPQLADAIIPAAGAALDVTSPAFNDGAPVPKMYGAEGQNISPPLGWGAGPAGTRSYALIMEDPDVSREPPFVHWILYNVPAEVTRLDEAVPGSPWLPKPEGRAAGDQRPRLDWLLRPTAARW